jgi:DNA-binding transcriptional ArsR family regulator
MKLKSACSECFAGLSCGIRVEIVNLLCNKKKMSVTDITKHFEVTQPTITHHLTYLKSAGILKSKNEGRNVFYYVDPKCGWEECNIFS